MAQPPAGYSLQRGAYFTADGQGPYAWDGVAMSLIGESASTAGALPQFGAVRAVEDWQVYEITATQTVIAGPCIVKGFRCAVVGSITNVGVYDATSATGTNLMPLGAAPAANTEYLFTSEGGVLFANGLHMVVTGAGGTLLVYARPEEV